MVMIPPDFRSPRILPLLALAVLLAGCATQPAPIAPPIPDITVSDLKTAARIAYQQGFEAGRVYQRRVDLRRLGAAKMPAPGVPTAPDAPSPIQPPTANQPLPPGNSTLPPSANYTTSGPAQPLQ